MQPLSVEHKLFRRQQQQLPKHQQISK